MAQETIYQNAGAEDDLDQAPSPPEITPHPMTTERARLEAALRDLISRVDHVRSVIGYSAAMLDTREIIALLDTSEAREVLGLSCSTPAGPHSAAE